MIRLHMQGVDPQNELIVGPAPWFRISGNFIRQGPHGEIIGTFRNHHWELRSTPFTVIQCLDPVSVHFEDVFGGMTEIFGPFTNLRCHDGTVFLGNETFAKFMEETQLWHSYAQANFWPVLVLARAA